jgi:hypothetical protein
MAPASKQFLSHFVPRNRLDRTGINFVAALLDLFRPGGLNVGIRLGVQSRQKQTRQSGAILFWQFRRRVVNFL